MDCEFSPGSGWSEIMSENVGYPCTICLWYRNPSHVSSSHRFLSVFFEWTLL